MIYKLHQEYPVRNGLIRFAVYGGWIYLRTTSDGESIVFVADPSVEIEGQEKKPEVFVAAFQKVEPETTSTGEIKE